MRKIKVNCMIIISILLITISSCTHKKDGQIIKCSDGKLYRLKQATPSESYFLIEVDTDNINYFYK